VQTVKRSFTCRDNIRALQVGFEAADGTVHKFPAIVWIVPKQFMSSACPG
jgi:hypothetical protein